MTPVLAHQKRVNVTRETYCFVVRVDDEPVLRCTVRREAMRYAVMVRTALRRAGFLVNAHK